MATQSKSQDQEHSLKLHEVLEEEFRQLHGELPPTYPTDDNEKLRLKSIWNEIHGLDEKRAALCISGGGIRSATFALGVLQGLARCGILDKFHYLSTVSGGGYIGSWLAAWIHRNDNGLEGVVSQLAKPLSDDRPNPEPVEIQNLRSYSNYLSPQLGLLSADTWTLVAIYIRNLILTWLVFIPLLAAALTLPWIHASVLMTNPTPYTNIPLWAGAVCVAISVAFMGISLPCGGNKRTSQGAFLIFCLTPLFLSALFMTTEWAWFTRYGGKIPAWSFLGLTSPHSSVPFIYLGILMHFASWVSSLLRAHGFIFKEFLAVIASGALGGWLLWLAAAKLFPQPVACAELYCCFAVPLFMILFFFAITAFAGLSSRWTKDEDREWWGRATGWILIAVLGWIAISTLVIFGPLLLSWTVSTLAAGGIAGLLTMLAGHSSLIPGGPKQKDTCGPIALLLSKATTIAALIFATVLLIVISYGTNWMLLHIGQSLHFAWNLDTVSSVVGKKVAYLNVILYSPAWAVIAVTATALVFGVTTAFFINPNKFSLHAMYRDRLIRAYLGASHKDRDPNPFTGFDESDNLKMRTVWLNEKFGKRLMPVVNIALNLVSGSKLAWQERKAASFTVSPLHCGSHSVDYRHTATPDGKYYGGEQGISLGTAVTISGAAASPNMGYHSSPLVAFVLTLLNVRLGAWLGNPGPKGSHTYQLGYPTFSVGPTIAEAFGLTDDKTPYVYLSDGGHFENLGLYEMVLRRCHFIVVSDAGQDPECSFGDLGGAVRKIRIDFGIPIEFDDISIYARSDDSEQNTKGRNCAIGRIRYSLVDGPAASDGILIYIKPACYGDEPRDIYEYYKTSKTFPHESTSDQFFTESQFESYRMLGRHTMEKLCASAPGKFTEFTREILSRHLDKKPPTWLESWLAPTADSKLTQTGKTSQPA